MTEDFFASLLLALFPSVYVSSALGAGRFFRSSAEQVQPFRATYAKNLSLSVVLSVARWFFPWPRRQQRRW